jgi:hypothetical protein
VEEAQDELISSLFQGEMSREEESHTGEEDGKFPLCRDEFNSFLEMTIRQ